MTTYIDPPIQSNASALLQQGIDSLKARIAGWQPAAGSLELLVMEAVSQWAADQAEVASKVPRSILRYYGENVLQMPQASATSSTFDATFTMTDALGHTVPAGTLVNVRDVDGTTYAYQLISPLVVTAPATAGTGTLAALLPGVQSNGIELSTDNVSMASALSYVSGVAPFITTTNSGEDAETELDYLTRLTQRIQLLTQTLVTPRDFELAAISRPGVTRAKAIDLYDPVLDTYDNERTETVYITDEDGNFPSAAVVQEVSDDYAASREANFVIHVVSATYTGVDITVTVVRTPEADAAIVESQVQAALEDFLNPANFGVDAQDPTRWRTAKIIRLYELATAINLVSGVDYIEDLVLAAAGGTQGPDDLLIPGVVPLPRVGDIEVIVNAPA